PWASTRLAPRWLLATFGCGLVASTPCSQMPPPPPPTLVLPPPANWTVLSATTVLRMLADVAVLLPSRVRYSPPPPGEPALTTPLPPETRLLMTWTWLRLRLELSVSMP